MADSRRRKGGFWRLGPVDQRIARDAHFTGTDGMSVEEWNEWTDTTEIGGPTPTQVPGFGADPYQYGRVGHTLRAVTKRGNVLWMGPRSTEAKVSSPKSTTPPPKPRKAGGLLDQGQIDRMFQEVNEIETQRLAETLRAKSTSILDEDTSDPIVPPEPDPRFAELKQGHEAEAWRFRLSVKEQAQREAHERRVMGVKGAMRAEWRANLRLILEGGWVPIGEPDTCFITGLRAEEVDHSPSLSYLKAHGGEAYPGSKYLIAITAKANRHKADFGSQCLAQSAMRVRHRIEQNPGADRALARDHIAGIDGRWITNHCPCVLCEGKPWIARLGEIMADPITTSKVVRKRR